MFKLLILVLFSGSSTYGLEPLYLNKGNLIIDENFEESTIATETWTSGKNFLGQKVANGFYHFDCSFSKDKMKRITLSHNFAEATGDFILELKIKSLDKIKAFNLGLNDNQGHCLVNHFEKQKIYSYKYKEKNQHSFVEYADIIGSNLKDGEAYTITLEVCGEKVFLHIDDRHFLIGQNPRFKNPKTKLFFTFQQGRGQIDSIKVWHGQVIENPKVDKWLQKKSHRHQVNLDHDPSFKKKKALADTRLSLKNNAQHKKLTVALQSKWQSIRNEFPYFKNYAQRKKEKEAKKSNPAFQAALKEYKKLEDAELAYLSQVQGQVSPK